MRVLSQIKEARKSFIVHGMSLNKIAAMTKIPYGTLRRYSASEQWVKQRVKYYKTMNEADSMLPELYKRLIGKATESLDLQDARVVLELRKILEKKGGEQKDGNI